MGPRDDGQAAPPCPPRRGRPGPRRILASARDGAQCAGEWTRCLLQENMASSLRSRGGSLSSHPERAFSRHSDPWTAREGTMTPWLPPGVHPAQEGKPFFPCNPDKKPAPWLLPKDKEGNPTWAPFMKQLPTEDVIKNDGKNIPAPGRCRAVRCPMSSSISTALKGRNCTRKNSGTELPFRLRR